MQTDMHYYGTYAMARAAGLNGGAAHTIANAAEYVDDSNTVQIELPDRTYVDAAPTAHHPVNAQNLDGVDQRRVWIPFHFIPGNTGTTFEERLICQKDSAIAQEMVQHHLNLPMSGFNLELLGITAHVYADTFSHYGFSGISSDLNRVDLNSIDLKVKDPAILKYITSKTEKFFEKCIAPFPNAVALGHGGVSTYPDRPYLTWSFNYELGKRPSGSRNNQATFLEACEKLHDMFHRFCGLHSLLKDDVSFRPFASIRNAVADVLVIEGDKETRIEAWQAAVKAGNIFGNPSSAPIPTYANNFAKDVEILKRHTAATIQGTAGYGFLAAARTHREYVLSELLPNHGLHVLFA